MDGHELHPYNIITVLDFKTYYIIVRNHPSNLIDYACIVFLILKLYTHCYTTLLHHVMLSQIKRTSSCVVKVGNTNEVIEPIDGVEPSMHTPTVP